LLEEPRGSLHVVFGHFSRRIQVKCTRIGCPAG
jgi:hypothetical protein